MGGGGSSRPGIRLRCLSYLVLLEGDLPNLAVPHKGPSYSVHAFSSPDPNDEVWREESDLLSDFPLEKAVGRLKISGSRPYPFRTLALAISLTRHHSSLESSMTVIFSPGLG